MTGAVDLVVNVNPPDDFFRSDYEGRRATLARIADAGLDGLFYADHVSFKGGHGMESLVLMAGLTQLHPTLGVYLGVYLLPLRHPVPVARSLSTLSQLAPGRVVFGVGVGGEDRHEMEICGIDPRTRGRRCDEQLAILRPLLEGESVTFHGEFYDIDDALVLPPPRPAMPVVVGGRSDAAVRRSGRFGDGWIGSWCSVRRFHEACALATETAEEAGRGIVAWQHGLQFWSGLARDRATARSYVKAGMENFYRVPFESFERYTPYGTPDEVAEFLAPFVAAGARTLNLTGCAGSSAEAVELSGEVKRLLLERLS